MKSVVCCSALMGLTMLAGCLPVPVEAIQKAVASKKDSRSSETAGVTTVPSVEEGSPRGAPGPPRPPSDYRARFGPLASELTPPKTDPDLWVALGPFTKELLSPSDNSDRRPGRLRLDWEVTRGHPEPGATYVIELSTCDELKRDKLGYLAVDLSLGRGVINETLRLPIAKSIVARVGRTPLSGEEFASVSADQITATKGQSFPIYRSRAEYEAWLEAEAEVVKLSNARRQPLPPSDQLVHVDHQIRGSVSNENLHYVIIEDDWVRSRHALIVVENHTTGLRWLANPFDGLAGRSTGPTLTCSLPNSRHLRVYCVRSRHFMGGGFVRTSNVLVID